MICVLAACGSSRNAAQATKDEMEAPDGTRLSINEAIRMAEEKPGTRAYGKGVSADEGFARQQAELDARRQMSDNIAAAVLSAAEKVGFDFFESASTDTEGMGVSDNGSKQNNLARSIADNIVASTMVIKTERYFGKNRRYTVYVCIEYNGEAKDMSQSITRKLRQKVSDENRSRIDAEADRFKQEVEDFLNKTRE